MFQRYLMRSQALLSILLAIAAGVGFRYAQLYFAETPYTATAACCLLTVAAWLTVPWFWHILRDKVIGVYDHENKGKPAANTHLLYAYACIAGSAAIAVETVSAFVAGLYVPAILVFALALVMSSRASVYTYYAGGGSTPYLGQRSFWLLTAYHALMPVAVVTIVWFLSGPRMDPFSMMPIEYMEPLFVATFILFVQFVAATEVDLTSKRPKLEVVASRAA